MVWDKQSLTSGRLGSAKRFMRWWLNTPPHTMYVEENIRLTNLAATALRHWIISMTDAIFWDTASCRSYVKRRFGGTYHLHLQDRKSVPQETIFQQVARHLEVVCTSKTSVHMLTTRGCSLKMATCMTTAVRTSNPTYLNEVCDNSVN
jgi:hypothetical protein